MPGGESFRETEQCVNVSQTVLVFACLNVLNRILECQHHRGLGGSRAQRGQGRGPGMSAPGCLGFHPSAKCLWSLEILPPSLKVSHTVEQAQCVFRLRDEAKEKIPERKLGKQTLFPGRMASKGGMLKSNPQSESIRIGRDCTIHLEESLVQDAQSGNSGSEEGCGRR